MDDLIQVIHLGRFFSHKNNVVFLVQQKKTFVVEKFWEAKHLFLLVVGKCFRKSLGICFIVCHFHMLGG